MTPAVFFDMDMTLINSRACLKQAINNYFSPYGIDIHKLDYDQFIGMDETNTFRYCCRHAGIEYDDSIAEWIFDEFSRLAPQYVHAFDGAAELINRLKEEGFYITVSTSTFRKKLYANFAAAGIDTAIFDYMVSREDVENAKPAPDIYLKSLKSSKRPKELCVVVEDALTGVKAAKAAGLLCLCVEYSFKKEELLAAGADAVVKDLSGVYDALNALLAGKY